MPLNPASFPANEPPTAKQLNTALYTYTPGSVFTPTGVLFHANRPLLVEGLKQAINVNSNSTGATTSLFGSGDWKNFFDNSALFGGGADTLYDTASGSFNPTVAGSSGVAGSAGGHFIIWGFPCIGATTNPRGFGAYLSVNGTLVSGGKQFSSTAHSNCSYALDLVPALNNQRTSLTAWCADASGGTYPTKFNATDYSGETTRFYSFWSGVVFNGSTISSVPAIPTWNATSTVTSVALNGSAIVSPLNLLNYPPTLRVGTIVSGSITTNSVVTVPLTAAQVDTYGVWNSGSNSYIVPLSGVYLVHGLVSYASGSTNNTYAIILVNSTAIYGPAYQTVPSTGTACQVTRLLDLQVGDVVQLCTFSNGTNTYGTDVSRLTMMWMAGLGTGNSTESYTPPVTGYRWQAGTSGPSLVSAFQQHLTNDMSFLIQRPYLMAHQGTAQTGLTQNTFHAITMDTISGQIHASAGDPYGGWNTGSSGYYAAPVDGWYLVTAFISQSALASGTASCLAAISQSPAGTSSPDSYQHINTVSTSLNPGAEAIGAYYLRAGDTIQPQYQQQSGGATFSTAVTAGHQSSFGAVWLCE